MPNTVKHVMPYGSIHLRVPDVWQEDASRPDDGILYTGTDSPAGPFRVRREDFVLDATEDDAFGFGEFRGIAEEDHGASFRQSFVRLYETFQGPDIVARDMEPETDDGQMFCYVKRVTDTGETTLLHGWVVGRMTGPKSFTIVSYSYAVPAAAVEEPEVRETIVTLDREICQADIMAIEQAQQQMRNALAGQPDGRAAQ